MDDFIIGNITGGRCKKLIIERLMKAIFNSPLFPEILPDTFEDRIMGCKKYANLMTGLILLLFVGLLYAWSIFVKPLEEEFGWARNQTSLVFVLSMISYNIGSILCGLLLKKFSEKKALFTAMCLLCTGFLGASHINTIYGLYFFYGVLCGLGIGLTYNVVLTTVLTWFPENAGMAGGVLLMGFGSGGFLFSRILSVFLHSDWGWRGSFKILALSFWIIMTIGIFIIRRSPLQSTEIAKGADCGKTVAGITQSLLDSGALGALDHGKPVVDITPGQMLRTKFFKFFFAWLVLLGAVGMTVISSGALLAEKINATVSQASFAVGILSAGNGLGRVIYGRLCDITGKKVFAISTLSFLISAILLLKAMVSGSFALLQLTFILVGVSYGSLPVLIAYFCRIKYGTAHLSINLAILSMNGMITSILGSYGAGLIYTITGTYTLALYIAIVMALTAALLLYCYMRHER